MNSAISATTPSAVSTPAAPSLPTRGAIFAEQLRTVGLAIRREGLIFVGGVVAFVVAVFVATLVPSLEAQLIGELPALNPEEFGFVACLVGLVFTFGVWKNESPWGDTTLWSLPVPHERHALLKIAAGWVWLMCVIALGLLGMSLAILIAGGTLGVEASRLVLADPTARFPWGAGGQPETVSVMWSTPAYQWLMLFTAPTVTYLLSSALWVGSRHPWRWGIALWVTALLLVGFFDLTEVQPFEGVVEDAAYTFDRAVTSGFETMRTGFRGPEMEWTSVWRSLPTVGSWAGATAAWLAAGIGAVLLAARRQRKR